MRSVFWGDIGFWLQNTTQPWHNRLPQSHRTAAHTSCLFIALLPSSSTPPYFFSQFQGSCKTSWDFAKRPQQHLFFPLCSRVRGVLPSGPALLGKGRTFPQLQPHPATGSGQHRTSQAQHLFPTVFILKIKLYHSLQPPLGCNVEGNRSGLSMGVFHPCGISPRICIAGGRGQRRTCLHKHLWMNQTLWSWPSPALVPAATRRQNSAHTVPTQQRSPGKRAEGSSLHCSPAAGGSRPSPEGDFSWRGRDRPWSDISFRDWE